MDEQLQDYYQQLDDEYHRWRWENRFAGDDLSGSEPLTSEELTAATEALARWRREFVARKREAERSLLR
jgi:hypothetical protein